MLGGTVTRLDFTFAVSVVSQFLSTPRTTHLQAVMRILRYLKKAPRKKILYSDYGHSRVACCSDADWVECPLIESRPHDIVFFLEEILCHAKKQSVVSRSSG